MPTNDAGRHMTDQMAIEANRQAAIALARMDQHVIECGSRYQEIRKAIEGLMESIRRVHERIDDNFQVRQEQFDQVRRDNKMIIAMLTCAVIGAGVAIWLHFK